GVRRIEAITNDTAIAFYKEKAARLEAIQRLLKNPKDPEKAIEDLLTKNQSLSKTIEQFEKEKAGQFKQELKNQFIEKEGFLFAATKVTMGTGSIKDVLFQLKGDMNQPFVAVSGGEEDGKASLTIMISDELVKEKELHAGNLVREYAKLIQGGGGGQPFFATAGGKNPSGLDKALEEIAKLF